MTYIQVETHRPFRCNLLSKCSCVLTEMYFIYLIITAQEDEHIETGKSILNTSKIIITSYRGGAISYNWCLWSGRCLPG